MTDRVFRVVCFLCDMEAELDRLRAENTALRKVVEAAREASLAYATMTYPTKMHELAEALDAMDSRKEG